MSIERLHLLVEGQTEEGFVNSVLAPYLNSQLVITDARMIQTGRRRDTAYKGGAVRFERLRSDLGRWMREDTSAVFSIMFDFYRLDDGFPGYSELGTLADSREKARKLEAGMRDEFGTRLIPYLQVHEFESLLFSAPEEFETQFPQNPRLVARLRQIRAAHGNPELIDDGPETAPSKRIEAAVRDEVGLNYKKPTHGIAIASAIGIERIRAACPHFNDWLSALEKLRPNAPTTG